MPLIYVSFLDMEYQLDMSLSVIRCLEARHELDHELGLITNLSAIENTVPTQYRY